jgi:hypothetical protein
MKKNYIILMIFLITIGCNKDGDTNFKLSTINYLENKDLFNYVTCFSVSNIHARSGFVIRDEDTYQVYADSMRIQPLNTNCDTSTLIYIDFNKYSLIGILTEHLACDSISRDISVDNQNKEILYSIDIKESDESCSYVLYIPLNLVLISKIPDNYQVEFIVNRHQ